MVKESYQDWKNKEELQVPTPRYPDDSSEYSDRTRDVISSWIRPARDCVALTWQYVSNYRNYKYYFSTESCNEKYRFICKMKTNRV